MRQRNLSQQPASELSGRKRPWQAKLKFGQPGDAYEREADRIADRITAMPAPKLQQSCVCGGSCPRCQASRAHSGGPLQASRMAASNAMSQDISPVVSRVLSSGGRPLPADTRRFFEFRMGQDFGAVRIHHDRPAMQAADAIGARAFTMGRNIVFAAGEYAPDSLAGRRLLAHELAHVVQQGADGNRQPVGNGVLQRQAQAPAQGQQGFPGQPEPMRYPGCSPFRLGLDQPMFMVNLMIQQALQSGLVRAEAALRAITAVRDGTASAEQMAALQAHFGANLTPHYIGVLWVRYRRIVARLQQMDQNDMIVCNTDESVYCNGIAFRDQVGACAFTTCGTTSEATHLCPAAFTGNCGEDLPSMMVHEAARAAGICTNAVTDATRPTDPGYPPQQALVAVQNIFAYESFAADSRLHGL